MVNILLGSLKLQIKPPKKPKSEPKARGKLVTGLVLEDENERFKVSIITKDAKGNDKELIIPFTPKSFELKNRTSVFTKIKDKHGKRIRIIRSENDAKFFPGLPEQYIPFNKNWIVKGYIVEENLLKMFDFKDLVSIDGYDVSTVICED